MSMAMCRKLTTLLCTSTLILPGILLSKVAQSQESAMAIEEIVVTSRKRDETALEVPDAITIFTAAQIENAGITSVTDIANLTPNMFFTPTYRPAEMQMTIRGIPTAQGGEAPVAVVIDGVQVSHPTFINQELLDIQQIEVLRGPQGSLYGRNAIGGAINIVTKQPTDEFEGMVSASFASGEDVGFRGVLSGPIIEDKLLFRVSGIYRDFEGQIEDATAVDGSRKADFDRSYIAKGSLILNASENLRLELRGNYLDQVAGAPTVEIVSRANFDDFSQSLLNRNVLTRDDREIRDLSLKINYDFADTTLTSISGYSKSSGAVFGDADFSPVPAVLQIVDLNVEALTQEVRLASTGESRFRWLVGAYYQDRDTDNFLQIPLDDGSGQPLDIYAIQSFDVGTSKSWAGFGSVSTDVTDDLELTLGLRYDSDKRTSVDTAFAGSDASDTFKSAQPKVQLRYRWSEDANVYASYARGFRSGGFNAFFAVGSADRGYKKEVSDNFEIGMKGRFLDDQLTFNAAAFHTRYDNQQFFFVTVNPPSQNVTNIDKVEISGLELDLTARPIENLDITAAAGFVDASIEQFAADPSVVGNTSPQSPEYTVSLTAQYTMSLADNFDLRAYGSYSRRGTIVWDAANTLKTPPKDIINLRLFLETERWKVGGYVDNLTDERYPTQALADPFGPDLNARVASPKRQYGVQASFRF